MTKNQEQNIHFYMQEADKNGNLVSGATVYDLERDFEGLTYSEAKGLLDYGKPKNIYEERYADSDRVRVHYPDNITREATKVTFTFYIVGENRQATYDSFYEYITGGFRAFWDNKRMKRLFFYCNSTYKPAEEVWVGSVPHLKLEIGVSNLFGKTYDVTNE